MDQQADKRIATSSPFAPSNPPANKSKATSSPCAPLPQAKAALDSTTARSMSPRPSFGAPSPLAQYAPLRRDSAFCLSAVTASQPAAAFAKEDTRPAKRMKLDFLNPLQIVIGAAERPQTFHVPQNLIISRSAFLKDARNDSGDPITLPDDDPNAFSVYLQCVYTDTVIVDENDTPNEDAWTLLVQTYVLADKLGDTTSVNLTMDEIVKRLRSIDSHLHLAQAIRFAFDNTPIDSKLRKALVDYAVYRNQNYGLVQEITGLGATEFLAEMTKAFMDWRDRDGVNALTVGRQGFAWDFMQYHVKKDILASKMEEKCRSVRR